jgi:hypothetical protein
LLRTLAPTIHKRLPETIHSTRLLNHDSQVIAPFPPSNAMQLPDLATDPLKGSMRLFPPPSLCSRSDNGVAPPKYAKKKDSLDSLIFPTSWTPDSAPLSDPFALSGEHISPGCGRLGPVGVPPPWLSWLSRVVHDSFTTGGHLDEQTRVLVA